MRRISWKDVALVLMAIPIALFCLTVRAQAYTTQYVLGSTDYTGFYRQLSISTDGRYVAFTSDKSTLVPLDTNNKTDAFMKDTLTNTVTLLSVTPTGNSGAGQTNGNIKITGNGRFVIFDSEASNLTTSPADGYARNVYIRDILNSTTYLVARGFSGSGVNQWPVGVSEDGRFVYYYTQSSNASVGLYMWDRTADTRERINVDSTGTTITAAFNATTLTTQRQVSCDGRYVVGSTSSAFVPEDTNGLTDVYLFDRMNGHFVKNLTFGANNTSLSPEITCDGNYVIFESSASNLVSGDTNNATDLYRYKVSDGSIDRVSLNDDESEYGGTSTASGGFIGNSADISADGRYIFYVYGIRGTTNLNYLVMRDTQLNTTTSIASSGSNLFPWNAVASFDGRKVFYVTTTTVNGDYPLLRVVTGHIL